MMEGGRVAIRKTKASAPTAPPHKADDVPVTRAMLGSVRAEVLERIDRAREEAKADARRLDGKIDDVKAEVQQVRTELKAEIHEVKAGMHAIQGQMARIEFLVEEQNARNKVVLDGITALFSRQDQVEQRVSEVEDTVRTLASGRPAADPT
jgi:chromosome segregation ATPase